MAENSEYQPEGHSNYIKLHGGNQSERPPSFINHQARVHFSEDYFYPNQQS